MISTILTVEQEAEIRAHLDDGEHPNLACQGCREWILLGERDAAINAARMHAALQAQATQAMRRLESELAETKAKLNSAQAKLRKLAPSRETGVI